MNQQYYRDHRSQPHDIPAEIPAIQRWENFESKRYAEVTQDMRNLAVASKPEIGILTEYQGHTKRAYGKRY